MRTNRTPMVGEIYQNILYPERRVQILERIDHYNILVEYIGVTDKRNLNMIAKLSEDFINRRYLLVLPLVPDWRV